jgi:hypothetical protein
VKRNLHIGLSALLAFCMIPFLATILITPSNAAQITATPRPRVRRGSPTPAETIAPQGPITATLCQDCTRVRLRKTPGTAGEILSVLPPNAQFLIVARSDDGKWLQVTLSDGQTGWVSAQFVRQADGSLLKPQALQALVVAGVAVDRNHLKRPPDLPAW